MVAKRLPHIILPIVTHPALSPKINRKTQVTTTILQNNTHRMHSTPTRSYVYCPPNYAYRNLPEKLTFTTYHLFTPQHLPLFSRLKYFMVYCSPIVGAVVGALTSSAELSTTPGFGTDTGCPQATTEPSLFTTAKATSLLCTS